jgi:hypothetical protein
MKKASPQLTGTRPSPQLIDKLASTITGTRPIGKLTTERVISCLYRCIPNAEQIEWKEIGMQQLIFEWRGQLFKLQVDSLFVEEKVGDMLHGSNEAALIAMLLKKQFYNVER